MRSLPVLFFLAAGLNLIPMHGSAAGNAEGGHVLARVWCSSCHVVDASSIEGRDTAPSFADIARRRAGDRTWLRAWLIAPHPPMPNFNLSRQEIDNIIAYLESLAHG